MNEKRVILVSDLYKIVKQYWHDTYYRTGPGTHDAMIKSSNKLELKLKEIELYDSIMKDDVK